MNKSLGNKDSQFYNNAKYEHQNSSMNRVIKEICFFFVCRNCTLKTHKYLIQHYDEHPLKVDLKVIYTYYYVVTFSNYSVILVKRKFVHNNNKQSVP